MFELLSDLVKIDEILFIVRNSGAVSEVRNNSLSIKQKEKWITIGDNDDPAHIHIDSELITSAEFVKPPLAYWLSIRVGTSIARSFRSVAYNF